MMAVGPLYKIVASSFMRFTPKSLEVRCKITNAVEKELEVLFRIIDSLANQKVETVRYSKNKLVRFEGIVIDKWSSKGLEGYESIINSVLPIIVDEEYGIWYQSFHPWGGVPDIMIDVGKLELKNNKIYFNGKVVWHISRKGRMVKLIPGDWYPKVIIEVKSGRCKRVRNYVADKKILIGCKQGGWVSLPWDKVEEVGEVVKRVMRGCRGAY